MINNIKKYILDPSIYHNKSLTLKEKYEKLISTNCSSKLLDVKRFSFKISITFEKTSVIFFHKPYNISSRHCKKHKKTYTIEQDKG
jgi:hypothetical protein